MAHQLDVEWTDPARPSVAVIGTVQDHPDLHSKFTAVMDHCRIELDKPVPGQLSAKINPDIIIRSMDDKHLFRQKKPFKEQGGRMDFLNNKWLKKRISQESAIIMLMPFGADWNNEEWATYERRAVVRYSSIWNASSSYGYALLLVVVQIGQSGGPAHPDKDSLNERLEKFKSNINIDPQLFLHVKASDFDVKSMNNGTFGSTSPGSTVAVGIMMQKLYRLVRDSSLAYYNNQIKRATQTMEYRVSQVSMSPGNQKASRTQDVTEVGMIRGKYCLKAGIYSEYNGNPDHALNYYRKAFQTLTSIIENTSETKLEATQYWCEFANYKICNRLLQLGQIKDAIKQLESFMDGMKGHYTDCQEYIYLGWLSKQYVTFIDLLDITYLPAAAESTGINADNTAYLNMCRSQYYISAAKLEGQRIKSFAKILPRENITASTNRNSMFSVTSLLLTPLYMQISANDKREKRTSIFRHRGATDTNEINIINSMDIELALQSASLDDTTADKLLQGIPGMSENDIENKERLLDNFSQVMLLLDKALETTPLLHKRRRAHIQAQMAEELMTQGKFDQAATQLTPAIKLLCKEQWIPLVIPLLRKKMACAIYLGKAQDYLDAAMRLYGLGSGTSALLPRYERDELHRDILSTMTSYGRPEKSAYILRSDNRSSSSGSLATGNIHESIFLRPEFGMAAPSGTILEKRLPNNFTYQTSNITYDTNKMQLFHIDISFNNKETVEVAGPSLCYELKIKSLFQSCMKFAEIVVHWSDNFLVQRVVNIGCKDLQDYSIDEVPPIEALLEFEYNKVVTIPLTLDLPESRVRKVMGKSLQECYICVESIDFVLRSTFEKKNSNHIAIKDNENSLSTMLSTSDNANSIPKEGTCSTTAPKNENIDIVDFILKCHTVPDRILRSRRQDEALGIVPKTYKEYSVTSSVRASSGAVGPTTSLSSISPTILTQDNSLFRVLHIVKPRGQVRFNQRLMRRANNTCSTTVHQDVPISRLHSDLDHKSHASLKRLSTSFMTQGINKLKKIDRLLDAVQEESKLNEIGESEGYFTLLQGCIHRINIAFDTCGNAISSGKLYLSSNSDPQTDPTGMDALFWYPNIHELTTTGANTDTASYHPIRTNDSLQPAEPILLPEQEPSSSFIVPLFLCSSKTQVVDVRLNMEYVPHKTAVESSLIKEFILHINFIDPIECKIDLSSNGNTHPAAALALERVNEDVDLQTQQMSGEHGAVLRGDLLALSTTIHCTNSLNGSINITSAKIVPISPDFGEEPIFDVLADEEEENCDADVVPVVIDNDGFTSVGTSGDHSVSSKLGHFLNESTILTKGEAYVGVVDMQCRLGKYEQTTDELLATLGSSTLSPDSTKIDKSNGKSCRLGDIYVEWSRVDDRLLCDPSIFMAKGISPPASQQHTTMPSFSSTDDVSNKEETATEDNCNSIDYSWIPTLGALSESLGVDSFVPSASAVSGRDDTRALNLFVKRTRVSTRCFDASTVRVLDSPFTIDVILDSKAYIGKPIKCQIYIKNNLKKMEKLTVVIPQNSVKNQNDNSTDEYTLGEFLIAGPLLQSITIVPGTTHIVDLMLVPLECGNVNAPEIVILWPKCGQKIHELKKSIFVAPEAYQ